MILTKINGISPKGKMGTRYSKIPYNASKNQPNKNIKLIPNQLILWKLNPS
tara:strand:+ start:385 stop:537 length:153 start_codon:yes stop_codon:yes gene_type:complete